MKMLALGSYPARFCSARCLPGSNRARSVRNGSSPFMAMARASYSAVLAVVLQRTWDFLALPALRGEGATANSAVVQPVPGFSLCLLVHSQGNLLVEMIVRTKALIGTQIKLDKIILHQADVDTFDHKDWVELVRLFYHRALFGLPIHQMGGERGGFWWNANVAPQGHGEVLNGRAPDCLATNGSISINSLRQYLSASVTRLLIGAGS